MPRQDRPVHDDLTRENLRKLWNHVPTISASQIGKKLGLSVGAVVGLASRMGLPSRPSPIKPGREPGAPHRGRVDGYKRAAKGPESIRPPEEGEWRQARQVPTLAEALAASPTLAALGERAAGTMAGAG